MNTILHIVRSFPTFHSLHTSRGDGASPAVPTATGPKLGGNSYSCSPKMVQKQSHRLLSSKTFVGEGGEVACL